MDSDSIHNLAIVRGGLTVLAKESGSLRPGALLRELEKLRDLFKGIDIAEENAERYVRHCIYIFHRAE